MTKGVCTLATLIIAAGVGFAGVGEPKETLVQGKPLSYWVKVLKDPDPLAREEALVVLAGAGEAARGAAPMLEELLKDKSAPIRVKAALVLGQLKGEAKNAAPVLLEAWKDGSKTLRHQILPALGPLALEEEEVLLLLLRASGDADDRTRFLASEGMRKAGSAAAEPLTKAMDHTDPVVRRQAIVHLGNLGSAGKGGVPALRRHLEAKDWDTRFQAAHALTRIEKNPRAVLDVMVEASAKDDPTIRRAAWEVVLQIKPPAKEALAVYKAALKEGPGCILGDAFFGDRHSFDGNPTMPGAWKTVRVFISSNFRDMHAERDHLIKVTFPALREKLLPHRVELYDIDLRWAITEDEAKNEKVIGLGLGLEQVDKSRPLVLAVLSHC
jgi:hypothetical protein